MRKLAEESEALIDLLSRERLQALGTEALHPQPASRLAAGLNRDGAATCGGAIVVVPSERAASVESWAAEAGVAVGYWDNGVPDTDGSGF